ncbi:MAG: sulfotransferase [Candidatus Obscuribacterales bacterium]|nr:sulfotransferase [Candidatus Obscuribacterales bacterium]
MATNSTTKSLTPILVTGMGRSGSTLAMQLLGTDPDCVFDQVYPLESRYLSLIAHFAAQWQGWTFADYGQTASAYQSILGTNPIVLRAGQDESRLLNIPMSSDVLSALWKQFSDTVRIENPASRFYAEKVVEWMPSFLSSSMDTYALYLFRDPRDLFLSANSFNAKRGYLAFGRQQTDTDRDHALTLAYRYLHRFENYKAFKAAGGKASLVRYEDLALNPIPTLKDLIDTVGIDIRPLPDDKSYSQHRTSGSIQESIERWKREPVNQAVLDVFDEVLHDILRELDYEVSGTKTAPLVFDFCGKSREKLLGSVTGSENVQLVGTSDAGLSVVVKRADATGGGARAIEMDFRCNDVSMNDVSECWVCVSGEFGGRAGLSWSSGADTFETSKSSDFTKLYDPGTHCTTLRFNLSSEESWCGQLSSLRLHISNTVSSRSKASMNIRSVKLLSADKESAGAVPKVEDKSAANGLRKGVGSFFGNLLGSSSDTNA